MSATRLLVLGVVRMFGRAHGYQVRRELLSWSADKWANVQPGSIYHALKKMTTEALLEKVKAEPGDAGPDRVAYQLTEDGEQEFQVLMARSLSEPDSGYPQLCAAVGLLPALPRAHAIRLLRRRLVQFETEERRSTLQLTANDGGRPHVAELFRLWAGIAGAGREWVTALIDRLEAGEYVMAGDPAPGNQI
ncbi:PadR family transcriptional regulator [Amycolatopsis sulphurea]|uniref:PadR family transcriptional regulator n=1 Tax=Amycolatopsis sulphurea TaxID=76022 RepID=A0A2A9FEA1_9PSEU|nr:PadR family transcriptional regulator [Amycolatopsis sulphurea]PFG49263.1 PadR family transcriptional regulator [Amycolatopsis sulphurea]